MLRAYVRRMINDCDRSNEVLQEVSLRILVGVGPTDPERFAAWSRGVARNVVARSCRMLRRTRTEEASPDELDEIPNRPADPEGHLDARSWMSRVLINVDADGVELLFRRYVLEETGRELADELDQSPAALRMRLMRLRSTVSRLCAKTLTAAAFTLSASIGA